MKKHTIKYVGLDTHKDTIVIAIAEEGRSGEIRNYGTIPNTTTRISHEHYENVDRRTISLDVLPVFSTLVLKVCHSFQSPLGACRLPEGNKKQENGRCV